MIPVQIKDAMAYDLSGVRESDLPILT